MLTGTDSLLYQYFFHEPLWSFSCYKFLWLYGLKKYIAFVNWKPCKRKLLSFLLEMVWTAVDTQEEDESSMPRHGPVPPCVSMLHLGINNDLRDLKVTYAMEKESLFCILILWFCHYFHSAWPIILNKALFWNLQYTDQETVRTVLFIHSFIQSFVQVLTKQFPLCFMKHT